MEVQLREEHLFQIILMHFILMPAGLRKNLSLQKYPLGRQIALKAFLLSRTSLSEIIVQHIVLFLGCDAWETMKIVLRKLGKAAFSSYEKTYKTRKQHISKQIQSPHYYYHFKTHLLFENISDEFIKCDGMRWIPLRQNLIILHQLRNSQEGLSSVSLPGKLEQILDYLFSDLKANSISLSDFK